MNAFLDYTLNMSGPGGGDRDDERNTLMRETAQHLVAQHLDHCARIFSEERK